MEGNNDTLDSSGGNIVEVNMKPSVVGVENQQRTEGLRKANVMNNKNEYTFMRGGKCTTHGMIGTKVVTNNKKWA